jgi:hypothetical protein
MADFEKAYASVFADPEDLKEIARSALAKVKQDDQSANVHK